MIIKFRNEFENILSKLITLSQKLESLYLIEHIHEYKTTSNEIQNTIKEVNKKYLLMLSDEKVLTYDWYNKWFTEKDESLEDWATYDVDEGENWEKEYELFENEHKADYVFYEVNGNLTNYGWQEWEVIKDKRMEKFAKEIVSIGGTVERSEIPMDLAHFEFAYKF